MSGAENCRFKGISAIENKQCLTEAAWVWRSSAAPRGAQVSTLLTGPQQDGSSNAVTPPTHTHMVTCRGRRGLLLGDALEAPAGLFLTAPCRYSVTGSFLNLQCQGQGVTVLS